MNVDSLEVVLLCGEDLHSSIDNEILFLHSSSGIKKTCNDGAIVGHLIRAESNIYISLLTVQ